MFVQTLGRLIQRSNLGIARAFESLLLIGVEGSPIKMPLLAIGGPGRTGSTLAYQVITQGLRVHLIDNLQNVLFHTPLLAYLIAQRMTKPYVSDYKSAGGFVAGLNSPAEAMHFWRYWLDQQLTEKEPQPSQKRLARFARLMNAIYARVQRPFLGGYLPHALYLEQLRALFPTFLFIRMDREILDAAVSSLRRWRVTQPKSKWKARSFFFGIRTPEVLAEMSPHEYVARQQYFIIKRMDAFEERHPELCFHANYSKVCSNPHGFIEELAEALQARRIAVERRTDVEIPQSFRQSTYDRDRDDDTRKIAAELDRLHAEYGPTLGRYRDA